jgi:hypothetical protein
LDAQLGSQSDVLQVVPEPADVADILPPFVVLALDGEHRLVPGDVTD